jgi:hypothetical protein
VDGCTTVTSGLNPTASTVPTLLNRLPKRSLGPYMVWLDNLFTSTTLLLYLRNNGYSGSGTCRINSGISKEFVTRKKARKDTEPWGSIYQAPHKSNYILQTAWKDNSLVLMMSSTYTAVNTTTSEAKAIMIHQNLKAGDRIGETIIVRNRKRPSHTSTCAKTSRAEFGNSPTKLLPIPILFDDYNRYMGQIDVADQLRATNPGLRRIRRGGWRALWNFIFYIVLVNCFLVSKYKNQIEFRTDLLNQLLEKSKETLKVKKRARSNSEEQHHEYGRRGKQQYCTVCNIAPKPRRTVLGELVANIPHSAPRQRKRKSLWGCIVCDLPICNTPECFKQHCTDAAL